MWRGVWRRGSSFKFGESPWRVNPSAEWPVKAIAHRARVCRARQFFSAGKSKCVWRMRMDRRARVQSCVTEEVRLGAKDTVWAGWELGRVSSKFGVGI